MIRVATITKTFGPPTSFTACSCKVSPTLRLMECVMSQVVPEPGGADVGGKKVSMTPFLKSSSRLKFSEPVAWNLMVYDVVFEAVKVSVPSHSPHSS